VPLGGIIVKRYLLLALFDVLLTWCTITDIQNENHSNDIPKNISLDDINIEVDRILYIGNEYKLLIFTKVLTHEIIKE
jgi:hypothetical protein